MMKRILAFLLTLVMALGSVTALADDKPTPISKIPYDQIPENRDGIYHYLLLCMDEWNGGLRDNNDGIVLLTFDTRAGRIMLTSLLRDSLVERPDGTLEGVAAVIDKDFAAELLAEEVNADALLILTEVEKVAIHFGKPNQQDLGRLSLAEAARYVEEGQFGVGSMLPKVQAAMRFVRANPGRKAIITSLDKCLDALDGKTGTVITFA